MSQDNTNSSLVERTEEIAIDLIDVPGRNPRGAMDDDHVIEMSGNIARNGLLQAIGVKTTDGGRYELIWGFHRLAAVIRLRHKKIMANIRNGNGKSTTILSLCENLIRKNMTLQEEIEAVGRLTREEHMSPSMICDFLNRSKSWVDFRLYAPAMPAEVKVALFEGLISIDKAQLISKIENQGTRNTVLNQVIYAKFTTSQTAELVNIYLSNPSMETAISRGVETPHEIQAQTSILRLCQLCGTERRPEHLTYIPVCAAGCPRKEEPEPEQENKNDNSNDSPDQGNN